MQFATKVEALIGKTPLIDLTALGTGSARILGKYEATNPGGSVKDRIARAMLDAAEKDGRLAPSGTVIEPEIDNTLKLFHDFRVIEVQIRLRLVVEMEIVLVALGGIIKSRAAKE